MDVEIVKAEEKYFDSHADSLDLVARERRFLSFIECPPKDRIREYVRNLISKGDSQFYAVHNGQAIGWCDIQSKGLPTLSHSGVLGMGIRKDYRGLGLGKRLIQATIQDAELNQVERIELWVFDNNQNAIALYLKNGFRVEGKMDKYIKIDGIYHSALCMARVR